MTQTYEDARAEVQGIIDWLGSDNAPTSLLLKMETVLALLSPPEPTEAVAMVVSAHGDPEAFGEREIEVLRDLSKIPYNTPLYASPVPTEPTDRLSEREGWVMVPREPTPEMASAFIESEDASIMMDPLGAFEDGYRAMLSALPSPPGKLER